MSWKRFMGVLATLAHHIAPLVYTSTSRRPYLAIIPATVRSMLDKSRVSTLMGMAFAACLVDLAGHGGYSGRGGVWIG
jgi:hypothetical protein